MHSSGDKNGHGEGDDMVEKVEILAEFAKTLPRYCVNLWKKCESFLIFLFVIYG